MSFENADEIHDVERRFGSEPRPKRTPRGERMQPSLVLRGKKIDRRKHPFSFRDPLRLPRLTRPTLLCLRAPIEFGLPVLPADPDDVAPACGVGDQGDNGGAPAEPAMPTLEGAALERHRHLCARRVPDAGVSVALSG